MMHQERLVALVDECTARPAEISWLEFKENNFEPERIGVLISAISNAARLAGEPCGYVIWGVQDDTHEIVGTTFRPDAARSKGQPLEFWLAKAITPSIHFSLKEVAHVKGRVVLLEIPAATQVPTKFQNIAYIRIGSTTPKLVDYPEREAALMSKLVPFVWEQGIAVPFLSTLEVLKLLNVDAYFHLMDQTPPASGEEVLGILAHDKLISRDVGGRWNILNVGAVLFANKLDDFEVATRKAMRVVLYDGTTRSAATRERDGQLGYAAGFEGLIKYVSKQLPQQEVVGRALRVAHHIYPEIAVRELLANALIHQDLAVRGAGPIIEVFSDRLEITNPGKPLVETSRFIDFPPRSRNETLAALMRRFKICEEQGSGIDKVVLAIERARLPAPDFRADGDNTKVIMFGPRKFGQMSQDERVRGCYHHAVIRYIENQGMTNSSLRERFGVAERNASQISRLIKQAIELQLIRPSDLWSTRGGHYLPFWA